MCDNGQNRGSRVAATRSRMEDVARLAEVSLITVSRAINQPDKLSPATLAKVRDAIEACGYVPNLVAGSLASNRSRVVAAIVPTIDRSVFSDTVRGLSERLARDGYQLLLGSTGYSLEEEERLVRAFLGRRVDALVLTGTVHSSQTRRLLQDAGIPVVETWELSKYGIDMVVGFSNRKAGAAMGKYLIERGHRALAFVGGSEARSEARFRGFQSLVKAQPGCRLSRFQLPPSAAYAEGREAVRALLEMDPGLDAIFFTNDAIAVGAVMECHRRGIRIPQDLAIAGFADLDIASEIVPSLTSVQVRSASIGEEAGHRIVARLAGESGPQPVTDLGFAIVARESA